MGKEEEESGRRKIFTRLLARFRDPQIQYKFIRFPQIPIIVFDLEGNPVSPLHLMRYIHVSAAPSPTNG
jgi:hypothetical protein